MVTVEIKTQIPDMKLQVHLTRTNGPKHGMSTYSNIAEPY